MIRQRLKEIFTVLTPKEKKTFIRLVWLDITISILDIGFLALLLIVAGIYSGESSAGFKQLFGSYNSRSLLPVLIFFILFSIKNMLALVVAKKQSDFIYNTASRISEKKMASYLDGNFTDYIQTDSAVYARMISQQPLEFCNYILKGVQQLISQSAMILLAIIPMMLYNASLFPLLLVILLPPIVLAGLIMKKKLDKVRLSMKTTSEQSGQHLKEALAGFVESNVYGKKDFFADRFNRQYSELNRYHSDHQVIQNLPNRLIEMFAVLGLLALITLNSLNGDNNGFSIITAGAFMAAAYKVIPGIVKILNSIGQIKTYWFSVKGLAEEKNSMTAAANQSAVIKNIRFENVSFSYGDEAVLNNFSFSIDAGELTGIAGISGKGKSTLVNLLLGFLSPNGGNIFINGESTTAVQRQSYWNHISYVKQQPFIFRDTIEKNITLEETGFDTLRFNEVTGISSVNLLLKKTTEGSVITEEGKNFSGGQRQRIVLARALYRDFNTLILDEPFSEMDGDAERKLMEYLKSLASKGKMVILITHNEESLSYCDKKISIG